MDDDDIAEEINSKMNNWKDPFEKANNMRMCGITICQQALKVSEAAHGYVLENYLNEYYNNVTKVGEGNVNNYTAKLVELLRTARHPITSSTPWSTKLKFSPEVLNKNHCSGEYESCSFDEVTDEDLKKFCSPANEVHKLHSKLENSNVENYNCEPTLFSESKPISLSADIGMKRKLTMINDPGPSTNACGDENLSRNSIQESRSNRQLVETYTDSAFKTAREEFTLQNAKKYGKEKQNNQQQTPLFSYGSNRKLLGTRKSVQGNFVPPIKTAEKVKQQISEDNVDERLKNIEPRMVELITNEIMHKFKPLNWNDIAGLNYAKTTIQEAVVWPMLRPDIFKGLRRPPRGILLFGPPGTGKTLIGKCIASQSKATFFSISASSLTSKWIGEGEKMVRALFAVAKVHQPSVIFIDEIDSLLTQRSETEHESSRRMKTEFLVQLDGATTSDDDRVLIVGATNRPQELDDAARRRLVIRLYIPLPELSARVQILQNLLGSVRNDLNDEQLMGIGELTDGYSGADMENLCREASLEPIRSIPSSEIPFFDESQVRPISLRDFQLALNRVKVSVSKSDLDQYIQWNKIYGSGN